MASSSAAFTSDVRATEAFPCGRTACSVLIQVGQSFSYVGNSTHARRVCLDCAAHYQKKEQARLTVSKTEAQEANFFTAVRSSDPMGPPPLPSHRRGPSAQGFTSSQPYSRIQVNQRPDVPNINSMIAGSFHKQTHAQYKEKVVPLSAAAGSVAGPRVTLNVPAASHHVMARPRANGFKIQEGYTSAHAHHSSQLRKWEQATDAHKPGRDVIPATLLVAHCTVGSSQLTELPNMSQAFREVDARIELSELCTLCLAIVEQQLELHAAGFNLPLGARFDWITSLFKIRDITIHKNKQVGSGVDLRGPTVQSYDIFNPYLLTYGEFKASGKKGIDGAHWKPKNKVVIRVEIPADQWDAYLDWIEDQEKEFARIAKEQQAAKAAQPMIPEATNSTRSTYSVQSTGPSPPVSSSSSSSYPNSMEESARKRDRSASMTSPPRLVKRVVSWTSPKTNAIKEALAQGGLVNSVSGTYLTSYSGHLALVPFLDIYGVLNDATLLSYRPDNYWISAMCSLQADLRTEKSIGFGAFKTAHPATLGLQTAITQELLNQHPGLGQLLRGAVVLKQFYEDNQTRRARFSGITELKKVVADINTHYWACLVLSASYDYIDLICSDSKWPEPPATLPRLRYIQAAVFSSSKLGGKLGREQVVDRSFVIEERIPVPEGAEFVKYIHNGNPKVSLPEDDSDFPKAIFLSALQHLQYEKFHRMVFISDFQGYGNLLTDAQIMTSPNLRADGNTQLFGDGNVDTAFKEFPKEHSCNPWCKWLGLGVFKFSDGNDHPEESVLRKPASVAHSYHT